MTGNAGPNIRVLPDLASLARAAAEECVAALGRALERRPQASVVLAGGGTPQPLYELLAGKTGQGLEWDRIHFFWGDERCVPPESPDSNFGMARRVLLGPRGVSPERIHRIEGERSDASDAAERSEEDLRGFFRGGEPGFDLILLGMGPDGHTASLFPGQSWDPSAWVVPARAPFPPHERITWTPPLLNRGRHVLFLAAGGAKREALACVLEDPSCDLPAALIRPATGRLTWLVDRDAAGGLQNAAARSTSD